MTSHIPEPDWRQFSRVHRDLLERFCQRVLDELETVIRSPEGTAHERYLRVFKTVQTRDKELARAFDDFRRSTALMQLVVMRGMGLLTDADLSGFSQKTQEDVLSLTRIFSRRPDDR